MLIASPFPARAFYFLRHGETDWNRSRLCVGQVDRRLTALGREQAREARRRIGPLGIGHVIHSPLSRAAETARIVAAGLACEIRCEQGLREACLGEKEGLREDDPADDFIARWLAGGVVRGAEPFEQLKDRVARAVARNIAPPDGRPVLLVSHWAVFAAISALVGRCLVDPAHCVPYRVAPADGGWRIAARGD